MEETRGAQIRAGIKWIEEGEKCNKYFLSLEKSRSRNNTIMKIRNENGEVIKNETDIITYISNYYTELYKENKGNNQVKADSENFLKDSIIPKLTQEEAATCEADITSTEMLQALKK